MAALNNWEQPIVYYMGLYEDGLPGGLLALGSNIRHYRFHDAGNTSSDMHASIHGRNMSGLNFTVSLRALFGISSYPGALLPLFC